MPSSTAEKTSTSSKKPSKEEQRRMKAADLLCGYGRESVNTRLGIPFIWQNQPTYGSDGQAFSPYPDDLPNLLFKRRSAYTYSRNAYTFSTDKGKTWIECRYDLNGSAQERRILKSMVDLAVVQILEYEKQRRIELDAQKKKEAHDLGISLEELAALRKERQIQKKKDLATQVEVDNLKRLMKIGPELTKLASLATEIVGVLQTCTAEHTPKVLYVDQKIYQIEEARRHLRRLMTELKKKKNED